MTEDEGTPPGQAGRAQRELLLLFVSENPGCTEEEILARTLLHWGPVSHHLQALAQEGALRVEQVDAPRFFLAPPDEPAPPHPLLRGLVGQALAFIAQNPGCGFADLVAALGASPRSVQYSLRALHDAGFVESGGFPRFRDLHATRLGLAAYSGEGLPVGPERPPEVPENLLWRIMQAVKVAPSIAVTTLRDLMHAPEPVVRRAIDTLAERGRVRVQDVDGTLRVWPA
jgi:DNA-binding transcriptional ArsR family regulator